MFFSFEWYHLKHVDQKTQTAFLILLPPHIQILVLIWKNELTTSYLFSTFYLVHTRNPILKLQHKKAYTGLGNYKNFTLQCYNIGLVKILVKCFRVSSSWFTFHKHCNGIAHCKRVTYVSETTKHSDTRINEHLLTDKKSDTNNHLKRLPSASQF